MLQKARWLRLLALGLVAAVPAAAAGPASRGAELAGASADRIVFLCDEAGKVDLCEVDGGGGPARTLARFSRSLQPFPVWSQNGATLAVSTASGAMLLRPSGAVIRAIPHAVSVSFSADGRKVAYSTGSDLFVAAVHGSSAKRVVHLGRDHIFETALSPDGSRIVYTDTSAQLFVVRTRGGKLRRITSPGQNQYESPSWSPDGRLIACYGTPLRPVVDLWVMRPDGSGKRRLVSGGGIFDPNSSYDWPIVWSRHGTLAYTGEDSGRYEVYTVDVKTAKRARLAPGFADAAAPSWSPDGRSIAFMSDHDHLRRKHGTLEIYTTRVDGNEVRRLTTNGRNDATPAWQPRP